jgi:hypothetical protein
MIAPNSLHLIAVGVAVMGWGATLFAADDVSVISAPAKTTAKTPTADDSDGTPAIHIHNKKSVSTATGTNAAPSATHPQPTMQPNTSIPSQIAVTKPPPPPKPVQPVAVMKSAYQPVPPPAAPPPVRTPAQNTAPTAAPAEAPNVTVGPTVETGLPIAHYTGSDTPIRGVSTYVPPPTTTHLPYFASTIPGSVLPMATTAAGSYSTVPRSSSDSDFVFKDLTKKMKNVYPWKTRIITTEFWIGEGSTPISSTDNIASSWDEDWRDNNHGTDNPNNRNGYASGSHASTLNPFYVALPFNDLAFPDKARRWLPEGWYRRPKDGKQVSGCKDRWVEIKNANGDICYAQWEDVGPLRYDHAEYVFGSERPIGMGDNHAGLDVSPAVAEYLGIDHKDRPLTSWRFVDEEDVRPGAWLKLDEQAVLYTALHQLKSANKSTVPIQKASEPIDDSNKANSNMKKVSGFKG